MTRARVQVPPKTAVSGVHTAPHPPATPGSDGLRKLPRLTETAPRFPQPLGKPPSPHPVSHSSRNPDDDGDQQEPEYTRNTHREESTTQTT